jgi:hypothetical protein
MKKVLLSLAFVAGIFAFATAQSQVVSGPAISVDKETHDYGTVPFGGNGQCEFKVTNTGTEPLIISQCKGSCGCTVPSWEHNPIAPGASSAITVKYDTKRPGPINKTVTITSNAVNEPSKVVRIKGTVEPDPNAPAPSAAPVKPATGPQN